MSATILMVTHDAFTASYANRILFIKDGKIFNEIIKGNDTRKDANTPTTIPMTSEMIPTNIVSISIIFDICLLPIPRDI